MRIFLSYAGEQHELARSLALALGQSGHDVFYDRDSLPKGESYDDRIRTAVLRTDLFLMLLSREALAPGAYPLTELGFAQRRWPQPAGRVLPVMAGDVPIESLDPYLRAVSILRPRGNLVAETVDAVDQLQGVHRRRRLRLAGALIGLFAAGAWLWWWLAPAPVDALGPEGRFNNHVLTLKDGARVRLTGAIVSNGSGVDGPVVRDGVEWGAWRYNRCYESAYASAPRRPRGTVTIAFDIDDQLPQRARLVASDFAAEAFNQCMLAVLTGQTLNAARGGRGPVTYRFEFQPLK